MTPTGSECLIDDLIDRWEVAFAAGRELSPEELCGEHPELLAVVREQIAALKWLPSPHRDDSSGSGDCGAATHSVFGSGTLLLDRYRLLESVGDGGFGSVWRAFDAELERYVAVKIPHPSRTSGLANVQFLAEARRLAKLQHPGIVQVFDVGRHEDVVFIVTAFVDGRTLATDVAAGPASVHEAASVIARVAESLHAAHEQGFVHRDIKPANILLDQSGQPYVTDFGIAITAEVQAGQPGLSGTLSYMAPEQARGNGEPVDARTDVFALGVVLYELLTGVRPFAADNPGELRRRIDEAQPVPPRAVNPAVPRWLEAICLRALARDPADRFSSTREMADAIRAAEGRPLQKYVLAAVVVVSLVLVGKAAGPTLIVWLRHEPAADSEPRSELDRGVPQTSGRSVAEPATVIESATVSRTDVAREATSPAPGEPALIEPAVIKSDLVLRGHTSTVSSLAVSADGRHILSGSWDNTLRLWNAHAGDSIREFHGHTEGIGGVALSSDGKLAASGAGHLYRDATLRLWDVETGAEQHQFKGHTHNIMAVAWAANGEFLVTGSLDTTIRRWIPAYSPEMTMLGTRRQPDINNWAGQVWAVAVSPDSSRILAGLRDHSIRLIDAESGQQLLSLGGHTDQVRSVVFSQTGTRCLSGSLDGTVRLWNLTTGETIQVFHPDLGAIHTAIFGPDETSILTGGQHHSFVMLDIEDGRLLARCTGHTGPIAALVLGPSRTVLSCSHDASIRRWPLLAVLTD
tara:strand:+ start:21642 stop:23882 length:2241 start_codon:yes stop_codon:yes gene_type:complete